MKKKVVYILHSIETGGVEVALLSAIPALVKTYDLKVIVLGPINASLLTHLTPEEKSVFVKFDFNLWAYPFKLGKVFRYIKKIDPQVVISSLWRASLVGATMKKKIKNVTFFSFIHSTRFFHPLDKYFTSLAIKSADCVLTDSKAAREFVQSHFKISKPIKQISFLTTKAPSVFCLEQYDHQIKMMFLGRINKVKNLPLIVESIERLRKNNLNVCLDIYGRDDGDLQNALFIIESKNLQGHIHLKGEVLPEERHDLYKGYHFYIQLSAVEGMAMSVVEAMQRGLVCIVTPVGEIPNYSKDMVSAIFIDINLPNWVELLVEKVSKVIHDSQLYEKLSRNAWQIFQDKPTFDQSLIKEIETMSSASFFLAT